MCMNTYKPHHGLQLQLHSLHLGICCLFSEICAWNINSPSLFLLQWPLYFRVIFDKKSSSVTESHTVSHMSFINKIHDFFALGFHSSCCCTVAMSCWDSIDIRFWRGKYFNNYRFCKALPSFVQSLLSVSKSSTPGWCAFFCLNISSAMKPRCRFFATLHIYQKKQMTGEGNAAPLPDPVLSFWQKQFEEDSNELCDKIHSIILQQKQI